MRSKLTFDPRKSLTLPLAVFALMACAARHRCGPPCPEKSPAAVAANPYGTVNGALEIDEMTLAQLQSEKMALEARLRKNPEDSAWLRLLNSPGYETFDSEYDSLSSHDNDYYATGKLRRFPRVEGQRRKVAAALRDSEDKFLFDRYRQVRLRIQSGRYYAPPIETPKSAPISHGDVVAVGSAAGDSLWSGSYRANGGEPVAAPEKFMSLEACKDWGSNESNGFRQNAYAFNYECKRDSVAFKQRLW